MLFGMCHCTAVLSDSRNLLIFEFREREEHKTCCIFGFIFGLKDNQLICLKKCYRVRYYVIIVIIIFWISVNRIDSVMKNPSDLQADFFICFFPLAFRSLLLTYCWTNVWLLSVLVSLSSSRIY